MGNKATILVAEDDDAEALLLRSAARQAKIQSQLAFVHDGTELMDYLTGEGVWAHQTPPPRPYVVLLDLHMPGMDGLATISEMRVTAESRNIPVIIFSSTDDQAVLQEALNRGANAVVTKPATIPGLTQFLLAVETWWLHTARHL